MRSHTRETDFSPWSRLKAVGFQMRKETFQRGRHVTYVCHLDLLLCIRVPAFRFVITVRKELFRRTVACAIASGILIIKAFEFAQNFPHAKRQMCNENEKAVKDLNARTCHFGVWKKDTVNSSFNKWRCRYMMLILETERCAFSVAICCDGKLLTQILMEMMHA